MQNVGLRRDGKNWILALVFYLLVFHDPLTRVVPVFSYIDEGIAVLGVLVILCEVIRTKKLPIYKTDKHLLFAMALFVMVGLLGNVLHKYQKTIAVATDVIINLKFFLSIITGYKLLQYFGYERIQGVFRKQSKIVSVVLFVLLAVNLVLKIFPTADVRYGLDSQKLIFSHPTFLASVAVFLLMILTAFYERGNRAYILLTLVIMFFTLRLKAIAGVAVYAAIWFFVMYQRKKISFWHVLLLVCVAAVIAFDQISYYYIESADRSARALLTLRSLDIAKDYFPIGTGFGTFASNVASEYYSQVYYMYGLSDVWGLAEGQAFFGSDTFWPIIIGQTGVVGTICYVYMLFNLFWRVLPVRKMSIPLYASGIYIFAYMLISTTSEAAFCNAISIPLAVMFGCILARKRLLAL